MSLMAARNVAKKIQSNQSIDNKINELTNEKVTEREAILLVKIESLEKELEKYKQKPATSDSSRSPSRASSRNEKINEKNKLHALEILQSVFKGHLERVENIKQFHEESEREQMENMKKEMELIGLKEKNEPKRPLRSRSRSRSPTPSIQMHHIREKNDRERHERPPSMISINRPSREIIISSSDDETHKSGQKDDQKQKLINNKEEPKKVVKTDTNCCPSPWSKKK